LDTGNRAGRDRQVARVTRGEMTLAGKAAIVGICSTPTTVAGSLTLSPNMSWSFSSNHRACQRTPTCSIDDVDGFTFYGGVSTPRCSPRCWEFPNYVLVQWLPGGGVGISRIGRVGRGSGHFGMAEVVVSVMALQQNIAGWGPRYVRKQSERTVDWSIRPLLRPATSTLSCRRV